jgi:PhoH-like ATPase
MTDAHMYVLDTNVLVHDPQSFFSFGNASVGVPITALEELDKFKGENSQRGRNTREVIRYLDLLRERGSLAEGVPLDNGGTLRVIFMPEEPNLPPSLDLHDPDNQILATVKALVSGKKQIRFISKDLNMRVKADVIGIEAHDYLKDNVSEDQFYKGWVTIQVPSVQLKKVVPDDLLAIQDEYAFTLNEFVVAESRHNSHIYRVFRYLGKNNFIPVEPAGLKWPIEPRNQQQLMALNLLLDPSIQLVTLLGPAGTGKTFLALVAALHALLIEDSFERVLVSRPVIPLGPDIGYLPGDVREKLHSWMQPIYDNMDFIVHTVHGSLPHGGYHTEDEKPSGSKGGKHQKVKRHREERGGIPPLDELVRRGKVSLEAITYMRGRSIPYQFIIIDEAQNLTPHEVKTIISRVGEGSKMVLLGDPYQIDSPYLDFKSNGLSVASQKFKGQKLFGTVFLETSERSELSKLAGQLL